MKEVTLDKRVILIVDDDPEIRSIVKNYMIHFGFKNFIEAKDGAEAYRFVLDTIQRIDLIISDWEMPLTDGLALLRAVRKHTSRSETPFIMVTSQQSQERLKISNAKKHQVDCYIIKPFRAEVLKEKVWHALNLHELARKAAA